MPVDLTIAFNDTARRENVATLEGAADKACEWLKSLTPYFSNDIHMRIYVEVYDPDVNAHVNQANKPAH